MSDLIDRKALLDALEYYEDRYNSSQDLNIPIEEFKQAMRFVIREVKTMDATPIPNKILNKEELLAILRDIKSQSNNIDDSVQDIYNSGADNIIDAIEQMEDPTSHYHRDHNFVNVKVDLNNNYLGITVSGDIYMMQANGPREWVKL